MDENTCIICYEYLKNEENFKYKCSVCCYTSIYKKGVLEHVDKKICYNSIVPSVIGYLNTTNEKNKKCPKCSIEIHFNCLEEWLINNNTCPHCRFNYDNDDTDTISEIFYESDEDLDNNLNDNLNEDLNELDEDLLNDVDTDSVIEFLNNYIREPITIREIPRTLVNLEIPRINPSDIREINGQGSRTMRQTTSVFTNFSWHIDINDLIDLTSTPFRT